jgi:hypothetical protein
VPLHTEARIKNLCTEALGAKTRADIERVVTELRNALEEHILLAKQSLEVQVGNFPLLSKVARKSSAKE